MRIRGAGGSARAGVPNGPEGENSGQGEGPGGQGAEPGPALCKQPRSEVRGGLGGLLVGGGKNERPK